MKELQSAIVTKFNALTGGNHNTFYTGIGSRLYFRKAPNVEVTFPYCIFYFGSDVNDYQFIEEFDNVVVQFSIFSNTSSSSELGDLLTYAKSLFDWCTLTVSNYTFLKMERIYANHGDWIAEEEIWQTVIQYRILLES